MKKTVLFGFLAAFSFCQHLHAAATPDSVSQLPLFVGNSGVPLNMLVMERDHKLYWPAYDDASDLDGDGILDTNYKPEIDYLGLFDSYKCYVNSGTYMTPAFVTPNKKCDGNSWSGDYLNWLVTSRIDALRVVLYGGLRAVDTMEKTILAGEFVPWNGHTWGKEYLSVARDGYNIKEYTPISIPVNGRYVLFAVRSEAAYSTSSNGFSPDPKLQLRVITSTNSGIQNAGKEYRIWGWVSLEGEQGRSSIRDQNYVETSIAFDYVLPVKVEVCKKNMLEDNCVKYSDGNYKPTGVLHDYGLTGKIDFGLLMGTWANSYQGGSLKKEPNVFDEINEYGQFKHKLPAGNKDYKTDTLISMIDRIHSYGGGFGGSNVNDWGHPLGEMVYEALRYYSGLGSPSSIYAQGSADASMGYPNPSTADWSDPYKRSKNPYPFCSKPFITIISNTSPLDDSDISGDLGSGAKPSGLLSASEYGKIGELMWSDQFGGDAWVTVGRSLYGGTNKLPTAKLASNFAHINGLEDQADASGSYSTSILSWYGSQNPITSVGGNPVTTLAVALSSTLPNITIKTDNGDVKIVPVGRVEGDYLEQIVGFSVSKMANMENQPVDMSINGGRPYISFMVSYDDSKTLNDYDMDGLILYEVMLLEDRKSISIATDALYSAASLASTNGYTITGTTKDGIYLEVQTGGTPYKYAYNTPDGKWAGDCVSNPNACDYLPGRLGMTSTVATNGTKHTRIFTADPSAAKAARLHDPLWYAARYGIKDHSGWDKNGDGVPDNYMLVSNPAKLKGQLNSIFSQIVQSNSSITTVAASLSSTSVDNEGTYDVYRTVFHTDGWEGDLIRQQTTPSGSTTVWNASAPSSRKILYNENLLDAAPSLVPFQWSNLSDDLKLYFNTEPRSNAEDGKGQSRVQFIRGEAPADTFRAKKYLLGDIINSSPVYVKGGSYKYYAANALEGNSSYTGFAASQNSIDPVVYVGSNDGMLHAFNGTTGKEIFSYIPSVAMRNITILTDPEYGADTDTAPGHRYFVDGSIVIKDVYISRGGPKQWRKVLVASMGRGGREVFALDVTDPNNPSLLWEVAAQRDGGQEEDLGYVTGDFDIVRLHNGRWAAIVPNGVESREAHDASYPNDTQASLIFIDIETGMTSRLVVYDGSVSALSPSEIVGDLYNGLTSVAAADVDGDGIVDYAYAGDLLGNIWRFDLFNSSLASPLDKNSTSQISSFAVSFAGYPFYTAVEPFGSPSAGKRLAITAKPTFIPHPKGDGIIVIFGTGRYLTVKDKSNVQVNTMYGIQDNKINGSAALRSDAPPSGYSRLVRQTITKGSYYSLMNSTDYDTYLFSDNAVNWSSPSGDVGWYFSFINEGEKLVNPVRVYGNHIYFNTIISDESDQCSAGIAGISYIINPRTGGATDNYVYDLNGDGLFNSADGSGTIVSGISSPAGGTTIFGGDLIFPDGSKIAVNSGIPLARQTWTVQPVNIAP